MNENWTLTFTAVLSRLCRGISLRVGFFIIQVSASTGFDPSWSSLCHLGICSGTNLRLRRLVPNFYGNLRLAGAQTVWLLHFMLQMYTTQQKTSILNNNHPTKNNTMVEPVAGLVARL